MTKSIILSVTLQFVSLLVFSQTATLVGSIVDATEKEPLIGAHVELVGEGQQWSAVSDENGQFRLTGLPYTTYQLRVSYIGYAELKQGLLVDREFQTLGVLRMQQGVDLEEVQVVEQVIPVQQLGDTTQFNADAYKTMPDASAEDLIEKMPTVVVENGQVQAQGEDVKRVLVDGRPFFGNDPTAALLNLPAEVIEKVQIFDQQSDQAQFTGFDDGESSKTINIITRPDRRSGQFGKIYGGYGYEDKYQLGGNINIFNGDQRISLIGLSNNINEQNFAAEDLLGVLGSSGQRGRGGRGGGRGGRGRPGQSGASASDFLVPQQGGITSTHAFGLNYTDKWGDKLEASASYFFNQSDNTTESLLTQQYFDEEGLAERYLEESLAESTNVNHRLAGVLDYTLNEQNSLIWRTNLSWQANEGSESTLGQNLLGNILQDQTVSDFAADLTALKLDNNLLWRHKFGKEGRTFSLNVSGGYAPQEGENYLLSENAFQTDTSSLQQFATLDSYNWNMGANVQYTEPLGENSRLMTNYRLRYQREESNKETFDYTEGTEAYDIYNDELSNVFSNDYLSQSLGAGYNLNVNDWRLMFRTEVEWAELLTEQLVPYTANTDKVFWNVLPMARLSYRPSRSENLRVLYRTSTQLPSITQLQNVLDNSNPLQLTIGNPDLAQGYQHTMFGMYTKTNSEKGAVFFARLGGSFNNNYIATSTYLSAADYAEELTEDAQISVPVNLDGYYNLRAMATYGFPVAALKSNLNVDLSADQTRTPGLVNEALNYARNSSAGLGLTLSSNVGEFLDFTIASRSSFNKVNNSLQTSSNDEYFSQRTRLKLDWLIGAGIIFRTTLTHQFYQGLEDSFDQDYVLWNMSIGKKLFPNDRGEISLSVFDVLKQNNALSRNVTEVYIEDVQTNALQQYVMLNFKYDLRHFRVKG